MKTVGSVAAYGFLVAILAGATLEACTGDDPALSASGQESDASTSAPAPEGSTGSGADAALVDGGEGGPCTFDPSRIDVPGNGLDDDCSGKADDEDLLCDGSLVLASTDAFDAAKAMGLCRKATAGGQAWGVLDARYVLPDGTAAPGASATSWGLLPSFGTNNVPRAGQRLLALSSGAARAPGQPNYQAPVNGFIKGYGHGFPPGFPQQIAACGGLPLTAPRDGIALEVRLHVPSNAKSFSFSHQFFSADYGDGVCQAYNDVYAVLLAPKPAGSPDGNVVLDANGGAITTDSVGLVRACAPGVHGGLTFTCPLGSGALAGTGFETHASTGWLKTTVPVTGDAEITLRFAIWDSGDGTIDSTALFDDFTFSTAAAAATTTVAQ